MMAFSNPAIPLQLNECEQFPFSVNLSCLSGKMQELINLALWAVVSIIHVKPLGIVPGDR
jgi:hypothetical protein